MLSDLKIKNLSSRPKAYKVADGAGLFLRITHKGKKHWRLQYQFAGRDKSLSFGEYPEVSLVKAREQTRKARDLLRSGVDPSFKKQSDKRNLAFMHDNTFEAIAGKWFEANRTRWEPNHVKKIWRRLEMHLIPAIGKIPVADIKPLDILAALQEIERLGSTETTHRVLWLCNKVFKYAVVIGATEHNPALNIGVALKPNRGGNLPVIEIPEIPAFLQAFESVKARKQDKLAFRLLLLTALRTGELRHCKWTDIDSATSELRVRKEVMKMKEAHIVPLSSQAIEVLKELHALTGRQEWLFPNRVSRKNPVMSENVINLMIEDMGYKGRMVGHSFRKLFSTVLNEQEFPSDAIERQLAHREGNRVRGIYNHALYLKTRRFLMQWWADYLDASQVRLLPNFDSNSPHIGGCLNASSPPPHGLWLLA